MKKKLTWDPVRRGKIYCSPACGHDCTHRDYLAAVRGAERLARRLGPGWKAEVWENLGWHYRAIVKVRGGRLEVYAKSFGSYSASVGREMGSGKTPRAAIEATLRRMEDEAREMMVSIAAARRALAGKFR